MTISGRLRRSLLGRTGSLGRPGLPTTNAIAKMEAADGFEQDERAKEADENWPSRLQRSGFQTLKRVAIG